MSGNGCRRFLRSPHPLPLLLIFRTASNVSFSSRKFLEKPARQATLNTFRDLISLVTSSKLFQILVAQPVKVHWPVVI